MRDVLTLVCYLKCENYRFQSAGSKKTEVTIWLNEHIQYDIEVRRYGFFHVQYNIIIKISKF